MEQIKKAQKDITRIEWVRYVWVDITTHSDKERMYIRGIERPIEEMEKAGEQWDYYAATVNKLHKETKRGNIPSMVGHVS